ncbi:MAG: fumarylacetoacetate hydrolase family protein [Bradyrhizobium sp.]
MKLATFAGIDGPRLGIVKGDALINVSDHLPELKSLEALLEGGSDLLERTRRIAAFEPTTIGLSTVRLLAPLTRPQKFLAIGMNYRKHAEEAKRFGIEPPKYQYWFNKQTSCLSGPYDPIVKPRVSDMLDYEVELAMIIGKPAKHVNAERASEYIFGYTVCNDVSVRDWQSHCPTMTIGKSFDTHGPIGPWVVTADEIPDPHNLSLCCEVNGVVRQQSSTSELIFNCYQMIEYLSTAFTLLPGDIIATGTPEGVGIAMDPPTFLRVGDTVRCEVEGIGAIENVVILESV